ncbi:hypothetical protein BDK51DRAFT_42740 [Blyttiomyces helicus]|uniref:Uncharacterized protein n=1 Tax=Blyttiomyces helicus TaxID=388810 RepID=A0A4P9WAJ3_9FUNG|nr:hypothetical protein BDK51DRAFT_42740 [Blyttiomyces helicus]|eukprot:RKO88533.1 hypothetical protein BDK51DRAFT_42740 [Blyttiomyces helicus]
MKPMRAPGPRAQRAHDPAAPSVKVIENSPQQRARSGAERAHGDQEPRDSPDPCLDGLGASDPAQGRGRLCPAGAPGCLCADAACVVVVSGGVAGKGRVAGRERVARKRLVARKVLLARKRLLVRATATASHQQPRLFSMSRDRLDVKRLGRGGDISGGDERDGGLELGDALIALGNLGTRFGEEKSQVRQVRDDPGRKCRDPAATVLLSVVRLVGRAASNYPVSQAWSRVDRDAGRDDGNVGVLGRFVGRRGNLVLCDGKCSTASKWCMRERDATRHYSTTLLSPTSFCKTLTVRAEISKTAGLGERCGRSEVLAVDDRGDACAPIHSKGAETPKVPYLAGGCPLYGLREWWCMVQGVAYVQATGAGRGEERESAPRLNHSSPFSTSFGMALPQRNLLAWPTLPRTSCPRSPVLLRFASEMLSRVGRVVVGEDTDIANEIPKNASAPCLSFSLPTFTSPVFGTDIVCHKYIFRFYKPPPNVTYLT